MSEKENVGRMRSPLSPSQKIIRGKQWHNFPEFALRLCECMFMPLEYPFKFKVKLSPFGFYIVKE